jgi:hypothetical protein
VPPAETPSHDELRITTAGTSRTKEIDAAPLSLLAAWSARSRTVATDDAAGWQHPYRLCVVSVTNGSPSEVSAMLNAKWSARGGWSSVATGAVIVLCFLLMIAASLEGVAVPFADAKPNVLHLYGDGGTRQVSPPLWWLSAVVTCLLLPCFGLVLLGWMFSVKESLERPWWPLQCSWRLNCVGDVAVRISKWIRALAIVYGLLHALRLLPFGLGARA